MDLCGSPYIMGHSMEAHGPPWRMKVRGGLHGVPDNVGHRLCDYIDSCG